MRDAMTLAQRVSCAGYIEFGGTLRMDIDGFRTGLQLALADALRFSEQLEGLYEHAPTPRRRQAVHDQVVAQSAVARALQTLLEELTCRAPTGDALQARVDRLFE